MDAEVYPDARVSSFIEQNFIPVKIHVKQQPQTFQRFGAQWTPTLAILDAEGIERHRFEGFLPADEFLAQLALGLAQIAFAHEEWAVAERWFTWIVNEFPQTDAAPQALYWAGAARYKGGRKEALAETASEFQRRYTDSSWAKRAAVWAPKAGAKGHRNAA